MQEQTGIQVEPDRYRLRCGRTLEQAAQSTFNRSAPGDNAPVISYKGLMDITARVRKKLQECAVTNLKYLTFDTSSHVACQIQAGVSLINRFCMRQGDIGRITSYNVCYTKLLRVYLGKRIRRGLFRTGNGTLINADVNGAAQILVKHFLKSNLNPDIFVITSYSIHYTKLYDRL